MSQLNTPFDSDFDSFLNLDQNDRTPISASSSSRPTPSLFSQSSAGPFAAPSFQYDAYRQQTGLPVGGLANTFALNQQSGLYYGYDSGFVMPVDTLNLPLSKLDDFDFARNSSLDMSDMDFDNESPLDLPTAFYPLAASSGSSSMMPTVPNTQPEASTPVQRMYPGMHSQQAAAKAMQAQKQQVARQQQQQKQMPPGQKPLPSQPKAQAAKDPHVEESISRLLSQMRQSSATAPASASELEDCDSPEGTSSMPRIKKDEVDMDEDERLLNSEEGKKLSSKERRQLRNKVSARAFRSRRKEYIGQLEGEVAAKVQEADELRAQNRQLMEENNRLTDLTRMLLSSQAFSTFLQELSTSGLSSTATQSSQPAPRSQQPSQSAPKDVNPSDVARQLQSQPPQVNMTFMPEQTVEMSVLEAPSRWTSATPIHDFQVFQVSDLAKGPTIDMATISGKAAVDTTPVRISPELLYPSLVVRGDKDFSSESKVETPAVAAALTRSSSTQMVSCFSVSSSPTFDQEMSMAAQPGVLHSDSFEEWCSELDSTYARLDRMIRG